ncbi:MAG TPA: right-handed parallel beta-helix repeat-containing protein [Acidobacteriaceae bacterium]
MKTLLRPVAYLALSLFAVCAANGQATRTWVSGVGDDANPCSRTAPCKTFAGAISKTAAGGEIDVLDPGGFGAVTITKAITIDGSGGNVGSVLTASGQAGFTINAGTSDVVTLRNLTVTGINQSTSPGSNGVNIIQAKAVHIENCTIANYASNGIIVNASAALKLFIDRSFIRDNTVSGVTVANTSSTATLASVSNSTFENNGVGVLAAGNSKVTVQQVIASGNTGAGFQSDASNGPSTMSVLSSVSSNNGGAGLQASSTGASSAVIRISGVGLFSNGSGLSIGTNGNIFSYGDNEVTGGGTVTSTIAKQ